MTAPRVSVPVPAETGVEDRLTGSLTFRHAAYLAVAAAGLAVMLLGERSPARLAAGALVAITGVLGAAMRPYGEPLDRLAPAAVAFLRRRRAQRRREAADQATNTPQPEPQEQPRRLLRTRVAPAVDVTASPPSARDDEQPTPQRRFAVRTLFGAMAVTAVVAVAVARWPHPAPAAPAPHVVVVPVPVDVVDPWEEAIDNAVDTWLDDITTS